MPVETSPPLPTSSTPNPSSPEASQARPRPATGQEGGGYKDTVESILVAFILAFIFRAFVVEAFVIPTGSMATTLLGAHMRFTCTACGYRFDVNYSGRETSSGDIEIPAYARVQDPNGRIQNRVYKLHCPNCGTMVPNEELRDDPDNDAIAPPVYYGDRILVLKYLWLFQDPARWDVIVFKSP